MQLRIAAVGRNMPSWVQQGWTEYTRRMPPKLALSLVEVPLRKRGKNADNARLVRDEGESLLAAMPQRGHAVALDEHGRGWNTRDLARRLENWMLDGIDVGFMIGGPDGLSQECLDTAAETWSLGPLTLPHPLVRIVVAEQLYRAWSILQGHPYHRE